MIVGTIDDEPWYGANASLLPRVATGAGDVEVGGGARLPVPGAVATEVERVGLGGVVEDPQRARGGQHPAHGVGPDHAVDRPALVLAQAVARLPVPPGECDGSAVTIVPEAICPAAGEGCGANRFAGGARRVLARLVGAGSGEATAHDPRHPPPRQDRVPEAHPARDRGVGVRRMRLPAPALAGQRRGGTPQLALPRRPPAAVTRRRLGQGLALAREPAPPDHRDRVRQITQACRGGRAAVAERPHRPPRQLGGATVDPGAGQRTRGAIRPVGLAGWRRVARAFEATGQGHRGPGPPPHGDAQDAEDTVQAPAGPIGLARGAGPVARAGPPVELSAGLVLCGRVTRADDRGLGRDQLGGVAKDAGPYPPARMVAGAPQDDREPGARRQGSGPCPPPIGGEDVLSRGPRPAAGQAREAPPGRGRQKALEPCPATGPP